MGAPRGRVMQHINIQKSAQVFTITGRLVPLSLSLSLSLCGGLLRDCAKLHEDSFQALMSSPLHLLKGDQSLALPLPPTLCYSG